MMFTKDWSKIRKPQFDISDLESDPMIMWQNKHYGWLGPLWAIVLPTVICGLCWGDWMGGYFFAAIFRTVIVHHATFCVNSLAHWLGDQPFADENTPRDHLFTSLITFGEGYHNFHHEFPYDYRNAIKWYQYDPTKWLIRGLYALGLAWDLKEFGSNEVQMGVWQMKQKKLDEQKAHHVWPPKEQDLPNITWDDVRTRISKGEKLLVLQGHVLAIEDWIGQHPGGAIINDWIGKDATEAFEQVVHAHSAEAAGLAKLRRIAVLSTPKSAPSAVLHEKTA